VLWGWGASAGGAEPPWGGAARSLPVRMGECLELQARQAVPLHTRVRCV